MRNNSIEIELEVLDEIRQLAEGAMTRPFKKEEPPAEIEVEETAIDLPEDDMTGMEGEGEELSDDDLAALMDDYETRKGR